MEELKKLLASKYQDIGVYLSWALKVTKKIFRKDIKWIFYLFILILVSSLSNYIPIPMEQKIFSWIKSGIIAVIFNTSFILFYRKVIFNIEGKENIELKEIFVKAVILGIVETVIYSLTLNGYIEVDSGIISLFLMVVALFFIFGFLYFKPLYISRNIGFEEAINYNFRLSKGNKMRMFGPIFVIRLLFGIITLVISGVIENLLEIGIISMIVIMLISALFDILFKVFSIVLESIIYLNVEYLYKEEDIN